MHRTAMMVAGERKFRDFRKDNTLDTRQFQMAFRTLRQLSAQERSAEKELDVDATIHDTCESAGRLEIRYKNPRKNTVKVLLLMDSGGSMDEHRELCAQLFMAVRQSNHFKDLRIYYFHNYIGRYLYTTPELRYYDRVESDKVLAELDQRYKVGIAGFFQRLGHIEQPMARQIVAVKDHILHLDIAGAVMGVVGVALLNGGGCHQHLEGGANAVRKQRPVDQRAVRVLQGCRHIGGIVGRQAYHGPDLSGVDIQHHHRSLLKIPGRSLLRCLLDLPVDGEHHSPAGAIVLVHHLGRRAGKRLSHGIGGIPHRQTAAAAAQVLVKGRLQSGDPLAFAVQIADEVHRCLSGADPVLYLEHLHPRRIDLRRGHINDKGGQSGQRMGRRLPVLLRQHRIQRPRRLG